MATTNVRSTPATPTLRELRHRRGLTLDAISVLGDVDPATTSRVERGLVRPSRVTVVALAKALGISARRMVEIIDRTMVAAEEGDGGVSA
jgi:transcriptional regulator with XRE-family HTH domain